MMRAASSSGRSGVIQLLVGSIIISFSAVFVKIAHTGPTASGVYRNVFGAMVLWLIVLLRREALWRGRRQLAWSVLAGSFFAADIWCWHRSILHVGPGLATIMGNFQVFVLAIVGVTVFRERITWKFVVSVPLAIIGLFFLLGIDWSRLDASYRLGVWYGVLTALTYAGFLLTMRRAQREERRLGAIANLAFVTTITAVLLVIASLAGHEDLRIPDATTWVSLVVYGVFCQALGWIVISWALPVVDASRAGLLLLLQPTLTFIWDILFFGRHTTTLEALGAALALAAIYLGSSRRR
jgi:drug/metabolite transporter (DMT)-like permease